MKPVESPSLVWILSPITASLLILIRTMLLLLTFCVVVRMISFIRRKARKESKIVIGIFHPYCNAGGGGERVLWCAVHALQRKFPSCVLRIYTGDDAPADEILSKVTERFGIRLKPKPAVRFVKLRLRKLVEASPYPVFTLLGQSLGSVILGFEALLRDVPDIYIDTMGYAFTYPIFRYLGGCRVGCYTHYPTISTDMIEKVKGGEAAHNHRAWIAKSSALSSAKRLYYLIFAWLYGWMGRRADACLVNSTWTKGHIDRLWWDSAAIGKRRAVLVYPPCNPERFGQLGRNRLLNGFDNPSEDLRRCLVVSVAQFRPEKNHSLQLSAFRRFLDDLEENPLPNGTPEVRLVLIGGCRDAGDEARVAALREEAARLNIADKVDFKLNLPLEEMEAVLKVATIGLHTMWNEHFGIGIVELMAAGLIVVAHDSGGPKLDIVIEWEGRPTGFLASDPESYANCFRRVLAMNSESRLRLITNARVSVQRFSDKKFQERFLAAIEPLFV